MLALKEYGIIQEAANHGLHLQLSILDGWPWPWLRDLGRVSYIIMSVLSTWHSNAIWTEVTWPGMGKPFLDGYRVERPSVRCSRLYARPKRTNVMLTLNQAHIIDLELMYYFWNRNEYTEVLSWRSQGSWIMGYHRDDIYRKIGTEQYQMPCCKFHNPDREVHQSLALDS